MQDILKLLSTKEKFKCKIIGEYKDFKEVKVFENCIHLSDNLYINFMSGLGNYLNDNKGKIYFSSSLTHDNIIISGENVQFEDLNEDELFNLYLKYPTLAHLIPYIKILKDKGIEISGCLKKQYLNLHKELILNFLDEVIS